MESNQNSHCKFHKGEAIQIQIKEPSKSHQLKGKLR